ncbi:MAG: hypothetical protein WDM85_17235 [Caulobacteraceae bacterium]
MRLTDADVTYRADSIDAGPAADPPAVVARPAGPRPAGGRSAVVVAAAGGDFRPHPPRCARRDAAEHDRPHPGPPGAGAAAESRRRAAAVRGERSRPGRRLSGAGDSVRAAAASANGVVAVAVPQGQMRRLFAELLGIDVGRSLFLYLSNDQKPTPVRCAVAEFQARDGLLTAQRLTVDNRRGVGAGRRRHRLAQ